MAAQRKQKQKAEDPDAKAVTAGINAFDLGVKAADCPYRGERAEFWHMGWNERRTVRERWDSYPDRVEAMIARAAPYIDGPKAAGQLPQSQILLLGFYSIGSSSPDDGFAYVERNLARLRVEYLQRRA